MSTTLNATDDLWRRTFDAMRDGVSVHSRDGIILRAPEASRRDAGKKEKARHLW